MVVENRTTYHAPACMCIEIWIFVDISKKNVCDCETKHVYTGWSDVPARWDPYLGIYRSSKFDYGPVPVQKKRSLFFNGFVTYTNDSRRNIVRRKKRTRQSLYRISRTLFFSYLRAV